MYLLGVDLAVYVMSVADTLGYKFRLRGVFWESSYLCMSRFSMMPPHGSRLRC
ncbi:MAG: hypothetical protein QW297_10540 [Candidatus Jordarchaeales archaeon]